VIFGECVYCLAPTATQCAEECPSYSKEQCEGCKKFFWLKHSRMEPMAYPLEAFEVDEETKRLKRTGPAVSIWDELFEACPNPETCNCLAGRAIARGRALEKLVNQFEDADTGFCIITNKGKKFPAEAMMLEFKALKKVAQAARGFTHRSEELAEALRELDALETNPGENVSKG
jgi:hypothetical protein